MSNQASDLSSSILSMYARLTRPIPEGRLKKAVRLMSLRYKFFLFDEFAINWGETYVQVGTPNPEKLIKLSHLVGPAGRVIVFEAAPTNIRAHREVITQHGLENVTLVPKAISDKRGTAQFLVAPVALDHRLVFDDVLVDNDFISNDYYIDRIDVEVDTLDHALEELGVDRIDYISITINGAETAALRGMTTYLHRVQRAYIKGHNIDKATGLPLHVEQAEILVQYGFKVKITKPSPSSAKTIEWGQRMGDVFAYR